MQLQNNSSNMDISLIIRLRCNWINDAEHVHGKVVNIFRHNNLIFIRSFAHIFLTVAAHSPMFFKSNSLKAWLNIR